MNLSILFSALFGLVMTHASVHVGETKTFLSCQHVDQSIPMAAFRKFDVSAEARELSQFVDGDINSMTAIGRTELKGNETEFIAQFEREADSVQIAAIVGRPSFNVQLEGRLKLEKNETNLSFDYAVATKTSRISALYPFNCQGEF